MNICGKEGSIDKVDASKEQVVVEKDIPNCDQVEILVEDEGEEEWEDVDNVVNVHTDI